MDSTELNAYQWQQLSVKFQRLGGELQRMINRMQELKFPEDDPLYKAVWDARSVLDNMQIRATRKAADLAWKAKARERAQAIKNGDNVDEYGIPIPGLRPQLPATEPPKPNEPKQE